MARNIASLDANGTNSLIGALSTTGELIIAVGANPATHCLSVVDATTGTDHGGNVSLKDGNYKTSLIGVSYLDGVTPVVIFCDSNGNLLVDSTTN